MLRMRSDRVVVNPPAFGQDLHLLQRVKDLSVQELISELRIEALAVAVLPGTSGFDIERLCTSIRKPFSQVFATNSGPLSDRICSGRPFITMTSASASITLALLQRRSGRTSKLSLVGSSIRFNIRTVLDRVHGKPVQAMDVSMDTEIRVVIRVLSDL